MVEHNRYSYVTPQGPKDTLGGTLSQDIALFAYDPSESPELRFRIRGERQHSILITRLAVES